MNTGQAIQAVRGKVGESQEIFARRMRVTLMTVSRWERNVFAPEPQKLVQLARLARELNIGEAATEFEREAGFQFRAFGQDMLRVAWEYFLSINGDISHALDQRTSEDERKERFNRAIQTTLEGQALMKDLMALAPHIGQKE
jgi:transcriptional regulator with XRE-family HTH domain